MPSPLLLVLQPGRHISPLQFEHSSLRPCGRQLCLSVRPASYCDLTFTPGPRGGLSHCTTHVFPGSVCLTCTTIKLLALSDMLARNLGNMSSYGITASPYECDIVIRSDAARSVASLHVHSSRWDSLLLNTTSHGCSIGNPQR